MAFPSVSDFSNELKPNEQVLRGGCLETPIIIASLEIIDDRPFIKFCQRNTELRRFLTGQTQGPSLVQGHLAAFLSKLREAKQDEWITDGQPQFSHDVAPDSLGSETSTGEALRAPMKNMPMSKERKKAFLKQFPHVNVKFTFGDEVANLAVKTVRCQSEQPTVEATTQNFRALHCWCVHNGPFYMAAGPRPKRAADIKARRAVGGSEYYRKDRDCVYKMASKRKEPLTMWTAKETHVLLHRKTGRPLREAREALEVVSSLSDDSGVFASASNAEPTTDDGSAF